MKALIFLSLALVFFESFYKKVNSQSVKCKSYDLTIEIDLANKNKTKNSMKGKATIYLENTKSIDSISLLLNRLLYVDSISVNNKNHAFSQSLTKLNNWESYHVNHINIRDLNTNTNQITVYYHGNIASYTETGMLYVKEELNKDFFIIRPESMSFPQLASPTSESLLRRWRSGDILDVNLTVKINEGYSCAVPASLYDIGDDTFTGEIKDLKQLTIPIAKYDTLAKQDYKVYYFPDDSMGAASLDYKISKAISVYTQWFGPKHSDGKFVIAEIPEGYGSQAIFPLIIQTADAFNESKSDVLIFHELSHFWNIEDLNATYSNRLNEGLAMFLQYLVKSKIDSSFRFETAIEKRFKRIKNQMVSSETNQLAISQFGSEQKTNLSYSTGLLFFALLYDSNPQKFLSNYREFYQSNKNSKASDEILLSSFTNEKVCEKIIHEWYETNQYVEKVSKASSFIDLSNSYKELD